MKCILFSTEAFQHGYLIKKSLDNIGDGDNNETDKPEEKWTILYVIFTSKIEKQAFIYYNILWATNDDPQNG